MQREIKFRAYHQKLKRTLEVIIIDFEQMEFTACELPENSSINELENRDYFWYELENCNLLEYTGLKDKNGKEIYEGDITKEIFEFECEIDDIEKMRHHEIISQVIFRQGCFGLMDSNFIEEDFQPFSDFHFESLTEHIEIIGNIYENPELLNN